MVSVRTSILGDLDPHPQALTRRSAHPHLRRATYALWAPDRKADAIQTPPGIYAPSTDCASHTGKNTIRIAARCRYSLSRA